MRAFFMKRMIMKQRNHEQKHKSDRVTHPFAPVFSAQSKVLVLGSFPSVQSRANTFYYGHPQNRFWKLLAALFEGRVPESIPEKTAFLQSHRIALWDVVADCTIAGSADSTLKPYQFSDIQSLLQKTDIRQVFANGQTAGKLYRKHIQPITAMPVSILPSTSPANAVFTLEKLLRAWKPLLDAVNTLEKPIA